MKKQILLLTIFVTVLSAAIQALACSPASPTVYQTGDLSLVLQSEAFRQAIQVESAKGDNVAIESIDFNGGVNFNMSNQCTIATRLHYSPAEDVGMCPNLDKITALTFCSPNSPQ